MTAGVDLDPREILSRTFEADHDEMVLVRGIRFTSICEHHLLPVVGSAAVAYIPNGHRVVGLSKIPRLVDALARRPHLQERMTAQIADALVAALDPIGAAAIVRATHACMSCRGARQWDGDMVTSCVRGAFKEQAAARAELLALVGPL
jgi:GTP cyclohydrolase I